MGMAMWVRAEQQQADAPLLVVRGGVTQAMRPLADGRPRRWTGGSPAFARPRSPAA
jgi:hypothetical protein